VTGDAWADDTVQILTGWHHCRSIGGFISVKGRRMSGDVCTSLGNGFTNLMIMKYLCYKKKGDCVGVVEGDDGLFAVQRCTLNAQDFENVGFQVKMAVRPKLQESSFCGMMYAIDEIENITDPREVLVKTGWTMSQQMYGKMDVAMGLLRAKGMSLAYELPGCPIARNLAMYILRITTGYKLIWGTPKGKFDWRLQQIQPQYYLDADIMRRLTKPITYRARMLVAQQYSIGIRSQLMLENYLDNKVDRGPLRHPVIDAIMPTIWSYNWWRYVYRYH